MDVRTLIGAETSISVSNKADCIRYGAETQIEWSQGWISERVHRGNRIGILVHREDGFVFDTYVPVPQPHPFHNCITGDGNFISPFFLKISRCKFNEIEIVPESYSDICCPVLFQAVEEPAMKTFFDDCATLLQPGGGLGVCFSVYYPCDTDTKKILSSAGFFEKRNKCVVNDIGFGAFESFSAALPGSIWSFDRDSFYECGENWQEIFSDDLCLTQHCRSGLARNYSEAEIGTQLVSQDTQLAAVGVKITRKRA